MASQGSEWGNPAMCPASALTPPRHPGVPHPPLIAPRDPCHSHGPPQYTAFRLRGVWDVPGTRASGALPDRFQGPAELGSDALCSVPLPRSPMCVATLLPVCCVHLGVGGSLRSPGLSPGSQPGSSPTPGPWQVLSKCCE